MRVASLPMYDLHELRPATDALWDGLARALGARGVVEVPPRLCRDRDVPSMWLDPELMLSQVCCYPLVRALAGRVAIVCTPRYRTPPCEGSRVRSYVVVPVDSPASSLADLAGSICAINDPDSHAGMNALRSLIAPLAGGQRFFRRVMWTGSHRASLELVARGQCDLTAVDCVSFALFTRVLPDMMRRVRIIDITEDCPGLPLITRGAASPGEIDVLRAALADMMGDPSLAAARDALLLDGFDVLPVDAYRQVDQLENEAARIGYPELL